MILKIQNALRTKNFESYFQMLESDETDYVLSCLMVHNIEPIRRQIAQASIPNYRHKEKDGSWSKGIDSEELKTMLHFKQHEEEEYQLFLHVIGAYQSEDNFVSYGQNPLEGVYKSPQYSFQLNKTDRNYYTEDVPESARLIKNSEEQITRKELIGRTWLDSDYSYRMVCAYMGIESQRYCSNEGSDRKSIMVQG